MSAPARTIIQARNVSKSYGALTAVNSLSFDVREASCVGLLGPNGAGKTTMLKMVYAKSLRNPAPGSSLSVFGHDPGADELSVKVKSGVVPQEDNLDEELDVWQNLWVYGKLYGMPRTAARARIPELLAFMELGDKRAVKIKELSGGMKRRLIIARALLNNPRLLILDEPTTGLDPQVRHLIWNKLRQLKRDGLTILLTTHYMEEASSLCDSVIIMHGGVKVMEGAPRHLVETRIERFVLEVQGSDIPALTGPADAGVRVERAPESVRFFSRKTEPLHAISARLGGGLHHLRETNLEDLFLQATGTSLDE